MAKRKKNESIAEFRKRVSDAEIMDTFAGKMVLDVNAMNEDVNENGIIEQRLENYRINDIVFSMRMDYDLLKHIRQIAREQSARLKVDVPYQLLISEAVKEKYPFPKN